MDFKISSLIHCSVAPSISAKSTISWTSIFSFCLENSGSWIYLMCSAGTHFVIPKWPLGRGVSFHSPKFSHSSKPIMSRCGHQHFSQEQIWWQWAKSVTTLWLLYNGRGGERPYAPYSLQTGVIQAASPVNASQRLINSYRLSSFENTTSWTSFCRASANDLNVYIICLRHPSSPSMNAKDYKIWNLVSGKRNQLFPHCWFCTFKSVYCTLNMQTSAELGLHKKKKKEFNDDFLPYANIHVLITFYFNICNK